MTRKEFSGKWEALTRIQIWCFCGLSGVTFGLMIGGLAVSPYLHRHFSGTRWSSIGSSLLLISGFLAVIGIEWLGLYLAKKWRLFCPKCRKRLTEKYGRMALLKGECPNCHTKLFEDDPAVNWSRVQRLDRGEFAGEWEVLRRRQTRRNLVALIILIIVPIAAIPAAKHFRDLADQGALDWITAHQRRVIAVTVLSVVCLSYWSVFVFVATDKFKPRGLHCPECGRSLLGSAGKAALDSRICIYCGCQLFDVPLSVQA